MSLRPSLLSSAVVAALGGLLFGFDAVVISGAEQTIQDLYAPAPDVAGKWATFWHGFLMASALIKYETIDAKQIDAIMEGREPGPPEDWSDDETGPKPNAPSGKKASAEGDPNLDPAKLH